MQVSDIHTQLTSNEFQGVINVVGGCITNSIDNSKMQIAYAGNGTYICTEYGAGAHSPEDIEASVKEATSKFQLTDKSGNPMAINVVMGQPENTNFWSSMEAAAGIHNALHSLELIDTQEQEIPPLLMARAIREIESSQTNIKDKAYHWRLALQVPMILVRSFLMGSLRDCLWLCPNFVPLQVLI